VDGDSLDAFLFDRVPGEMRLVSRANASPQMAAGGLANSYGSLAMSADGRSVAFVSGATNLVPGQVDANQSDDLFIYDRVTGTTELASHTRGSTVTAGSAGAGRPSFSADGRFLAFNSAAADLVLNQTDANSRDDVFLYDRSTKAAVLVSRPRGSAITAANGDSTAPVISADGGVVGFLSTATDLGEGQIDPNNFYDLFLYRRTSAEITTPSRRDPDLPGVTPNGPSTVESISSDGRYALFQSRATGLVPGQIDTPEGTVNQFGQPASTWDVFLRDTVAGKTTLLTRSRTSKLMAVSGETPTLSADGRFAAFTSYEETTNGTRRVFPLFLYDRAADAMILVNHSPGSQQTDGYPSHASLSADGRYVAYECGGCSLVPGHPEGSKREIFLYDRVSGLNMLVSHASGSPTAEANDRSSLPKISADGRFVVFASLATDLVPGQIDTRNSLDLFVFDSTTGEVALVTHTAASAVTAVQRVTTASQSPDGRFIAFRSSAADLVPGQVGGAGRSNVFLYDRAAGTTILVSHAASSPVTAAQGESYLGDADTWSADSRFLVYASDATDLVAGTTDTNGAPDIFLYDRLSGTTTLVSHAGGAPGRTADTGAATPAISADGSRIAFLSLSTDLIPGQTVPAGSVNLFIQDRSTGTTALAGRVYRHVPFDPDDTLSFSPRLSADGRRVAFTTNTAFVQGDLNVDWDVYLWTDRGDTAGGPVPLPSCRLLDTRRRADRPVLSSDVRRALIVRGACGVPATAQQILVKVTVFNPSGKGNLRFYPGAVTEPLAAILRFERGGTRTESFTLPLSANGTLTILPFVAGKGTVHVAVEVNGYEE
jgi:Tol biopolymer transport system component